MEIVFLVSDEYVCVEINGKLKIYIEESVLNLRDGMGSVYVIFIMCMDTEEEGGWRMIARNFIVSRLRILFFKTT